MARVKALMAQPTPEIAREMMVELAVDAKIGVSCVVVRGQVAAAVTVCNIIIGSPYDSVVHAGF
jgi:hypothetical protein